MPDIGVHVGELRLGANWTDANPETRTAIADALPLEGHAARWGDELYFRTPVDVPVENGRQVVPAGAIAYWPQGNAVCLFWGPTPASTGTEPRAASAVNLVALIESPERLESIDGDATVRLENG